MAAAVIAVLALLWLFVGRGDDSADDAQADASGPHDQPHAETEQPGLGEAGELAPTQVSGQVRSSTGEAIAAAVVTLAPLDSLDGEAQPETTRTDADGTWSLTQIPAGRYAISATAPGFLAALLPSVELRAGSDNPGLELRLEPGGNTLSGLVADKTGGVIEGALVQVTPQSGILRMRERESVFTVTDDEGRYAVQLPDGRHRVRASHPDYSSESVVLELAGQTREQNFALVPSAVVEGVVLRESDGAPVPHAEVTWARERTIFLPNGGRVSTRDRGGKVTADAEGRFRIGGLTPGLIELSARASLLASVVGVEIPVGIAERVDGVELLLAAASDVEGRVISAADGEGIADARVELMSQLGSGGEVQTDAQGRFRARGVLPGRYRVLATAEGWSHVGGPLPEVEVGEDSGASVIVELERGRSIVGRVEPPGEAEVSIVLDPKKLRGMAGGMMVLSAAGPTRAAADSGAFELGPVEPGTYTVEARTADGRGGSVEVEVGPGGAEGVVIALAQRAILSGRVEDSSGVAQTDLTVRARKREAGRSLSVVVNGRELTALSSPTSLQGRFEIAGLAAGPWTVEVVDAQGDVLPLAGSQGSFDVELGEGEARELVLRVEPRDGTISGVVRSAEGEPVADAWVSAAFVPELAKHEQGEGDEPGEDGEPEVHSEMRMVVATDDGGDLRASLPPVLTGPDGRFAFTELRRGTYNLSAEQGGGASKATLEGVRPDADVSLDLAPLGALEGRVLSNGEPASCIARIIGPSERSVRVRDGKFEVQRLEPGRYTVEASAGDGSTSTSVEIEAGATAEVELALERFATVKGVILDESGAPIAGAEILIGSGSGGRVEVTRDDSDPQIFTKDDGSFETRAAAGQRILIASAPGLPMPMVIEPFVVEAGQDLDLGELRKQDMGGMMMRGGPDEDGPPAHE